MVLVFVWRCQQASPGRDVGAPAVASLTPMIGVTSAETGAIMPMTATALAREGVAAGEVKPRFSEAHADPWLFLPAED